MSITDNPVRPSGSTDTTEAIVQWRDWHAAREEQLRGKHDWLSLVDYLWVPRAERALANLPGAWWADEEGLHLRATAVDGVRVLGPDGEPGAVLDGVAGVVVGEAKSARFALTADDVLVEVILRGGLYALRVRDPRSATLAGFEGVPTYDYDPSWVLEVSTTTYPQARPTTVLAAAPGLTQVASAVGEVSFTRDGAEHRLIAVGKGDSWAVLFSDETSGVTSSGWRVAGVTGDPGTGTATLDLNRAVNLPYAFTDYGTCPRPIEGNHLALAVTAGEKAPTGRTGVPGEDVPSRVPAEQPA
ncbi:DUF1684 domain-containing protein [Occultella kanbiaonis]|uniref:DUF1684 domain-containing protein n=1 Tax=Occultella kanbiaonis TaxID=2675754 RepID=UPI0013D44F66|nr:DUF1684 domain-containing protein [Occultella kanbiaonis]